MLPIPNTNATTATDPHYTKQTQTQASEVLELPDPPSLEDIPALCNKAIATIINKVNRKLVDSLRKKEDQLFKKSPERYHNNLKTTAGLQPNAKDQPKLEAIERRKKESPYKEGILKDIGAHVGYTVLYWWGGYLSGGTNLDTPRGRYTRAVTNSTARGL